MSDWHPQIVRISAVIQHSDANSLDIVTVMKDYPVVVKRGEYQAGDIACYIPIDTVVPDCDKFYFLCPCINEKYEEDGETKVRQLGPKFALGHVPEKHRIIKAKKLRGVYSQGMLMPAPSGMTEGESIVDVLGLKKWEEIEEENIPGNKVSNAEPPPIGWTIPHYDVHAIRSYLECLKDGEEVVLTEKIHGSNAAFVHDGQRLWVKSRNLFKKMDPDDMWWDVAIRYELERKLQLTPNLVFFGEVYGQIKNFRYDAVLERGRLLARVRFFDVWDVAAARFLDVDARLRLIAEADLDSVPVLYRGPWLGRAAMYPLAEGPTTLGGGRHVREGWVLTTAVERFEQALASRMQVKLVGEGYNLQK
jgi:RNA ligase (TIGR02306 family)